MVETEGMGNTLIAGIGNPLLRDDTVGLHAITALQQVITDSRENTIVFKQLFCGGFDLVSELADFSRAILIDCLCDNETLPGQFKRFILTAEDLSQPYYRPLAAGHGIDLMAVLHAGRTCGYRMPDPVIVYGIGASDVCTFDEYPTPLVNATIAEVVNCICAEIRMTQPVAQGMNS